MEPHFILNYVLIIIFYSKLIFISTKLPFYIHVNLKKFSITQLKGVFFSLETLVEIHVIYIIYRYTSHKKFVSVGSKIKK